MAVARLNSLVPVFVFCFAVVVVVVLSIFRSATESPRRRLSALLFSRRGVSPQFSVVVVAVVVVVIVVVVVVFVVAVVVVVVILVVVVAVVVVVSFQASMLHRAQRPFPCHRC
ncbi:unnamed protein product [Polarella glacialis]|uniref:Uncharacterized protein n=1 Tax=Polarella glacialis TaxID=89957 RepID=A0A813I203_POLGL|nr:unnamed protein product [Polarella glacialis]